MILVLLCISVAAHSEIYKWTDEKGNVHYGDKPVDNGKEMEISEEPGRSENVSSSEREERRRKLIETYDIERKEKKKKQAKLKKDRKRLNAECGYAKDRLKRYKRAGSLYDVDKDGNRTSLSEDIHKKAIRNLQKKIKKHCK